MVSVETTGTSWNCHDNEMFEKESFCFDKDYSLNCKQHSLKGRLGTTENSLWISGGDQTAGFEVFPVLDISLVPSFVAMSQFSL